MTLFWRLRFVIVASVVVVGCNSGEVNERLFSAMLAGKTAEAGQLAKRADPEFRKDLADLTNVFGDVGDMPSASALHVAAFLGQDSVVRQLLEAGFDPNVQNGLGSAPLHNAAYNGHLESSRLLIDAGAATNVVNHRGATPLLNACLSGKPQMVKLMLDAGADVGGGPSEVPLLTAALIGGRSKAEAARISQVIGTDEHIAIRPGAAQIVQLLLEAGADPDAGTITPLMMAIAIGDEKSAMLMIPHGDKLTASKDLPSPLVLAVLKGLPDVVSSLLEHGADPNERFDSQLPEEQIVTPDDPPFDRIIEMLGEARAR